MELAARSGQQGRTMGQLSELKALLPDLSDRKRAAAAAAVGVTGIITAVLLQRRRRRRRQAVAAEQQAAGGAAAAAAAEPAGPPSSAICTLQELQELQQRSSLLSLFDAPVLSVCVRGQGVKVATIPWSVCALRQLEELDLSGNAIVAVPASIGRLTALTRLNLSDNLIRELPPQIGELKSLVDLDLGRNQLSRLPHSVGKLAQLKYLNLMSNQLAELPDSIGGCTALLRCGLKSNRLTALPASIGHWASMVELYLTDNLLESLPPEMGRMTSLVKLQASFNPALTSLPAELGLLPNLELLRVACCAIRDVPATLNSAPKLAWMSLASNPACRVLSPRSPPTVQFSDLAMGRKLGDGASGEVFEAMWKGRRHAVKVFVAERSPDGHSRDEIAISLSVSERHLVRVVAQLQKPLGLVMEFAEGRPIAQKPNSQSLLRCRWEAGEVFQLGWVLKVAIGVAAALEHMHYRGICHGDVYAHNVMVDEEAEAVTLCDYGASFPYHKGGRVRYEAQEVRAFGLMLADMVQRLDIGFDGMEQLLACQRELLAVVQTCIQGAPAKRPTFGAVGRRLRAIQKQAARAGVGGITARDNGLMTPRTCMTEVPRTPLHF